MTELKHEIRGELSSLAGRFSEKLRAQTDEARRAAEMQENAALGERIARITDELMETLSDRLRDAAHTGNRTYSMCYMYVDGYGTTEFGRFHQPYEVAAQFGEAMCAAVRALVLPWKWIVRFSLGAFPARIQRSAFAGNPINFSTTI